MKLWSCTANWLRNVFRLSRVESEMDAELHSHIEAFAEDLIHRGVSSQEATRRARIEFGSIEQTKEDCRSARGINLIETVLQDLHYALRMQRRSWGFTAVAVPTLALGIGATISIFSVVKAVILNPLPFRQPESLVHIWEGHEHYHRGEQAYFSTVRPGTFYSWRAQSQSFEAISAYRRSSMLLANNQEAELVSAQNVYDQFFETLGTPAYLGRTLQPGDYQASSAHVVVISNPMWTTRFGSDPAVVGRRISLDRESYEIVGVMPAGFYPLAGGGYPDLWTPHWANQAEKDDYSTWGLFPLARLKPGITWEQAQTELDVISARISQDHPTYRMGGTVVPVDAQLIGSSWKLLLLLGGGVLLLLLIACVNVAHLLLARAVDREKEFAVRTALGASRRRLVLQSFIESLVFAVAGGVIGIGVASGGTRALLAVLPRAAILPRLDTVKVDMGVLTVACGLTLSVSLLFSLIPLLRASRKRPHEALKLEGRSFSAGKSKRRLGQIFVVSEFVFSLVLLILSVLLVENFIALQRVDPGFDASYLLTLHISVPQVNYGQWSGGGNNASREKLYERLEQVVSSVPGVQSVALIGGLPLRQEFNPWPVLIEGREPPPSAQTEDSRATGIQWVNPQFFRTLKLRLARGRFFDEHDNADAPRASVVNETFARTFFPNEDPTGKEVTVWFAKTTIVGIVADLKLNALDRKPYPEIFWSARQIPGPNTWIMVRTTKDSSLSVEELRRKIQALDSALPVQEMHFMNEVISDSLWLKRLSATLIGLLAVLAIVLATAGIYSAMSYSISQRRKELGIRVAFGANRRDVLGLIMRETCRLAILGCVLGSVTAFVTGRLATSISYLAPSLASSQTQEGLSAVAFIVSSLFLFGIAMCSSYAPACCAMRVDPVAALQHQ